MELPKYRGFAAAPVSSIRFCLGSPLARLEAAIAIEELLVSGAGCRRHAADLFGALQLIIDDVLIVQALWFVAARLALMIGERRT